MIKVHGLETLISDLQTVDSRLTKNIKNSLKEPVNKMKSDVRRHVTSKLEIRGRGRSSVANTIKTTIRGDKLADVSVKLGAYWKGWITHEEGAIIKPQKGKYITVFTQEGKKRKRRKASFAKSKIVFIPFENGQIGMFQVFKQKNKQPILLALLTKRVTIKKSIDIDGNALKHTDNLVNAIASGASI